MANNYLQFSAVIERLTAEERQWLADQLEIVDVFADQAHESHGIDCLLVPAGDRDKESLTEAQRHGDEFARLEVTVPRWSVDEGEGVWRNREPTTKNRQPETEH